MFVTFSEVEGMAELNDGKPRKVQNVKVGALLHTLKVMHAEGGCQQEQMLVSFRAETTLKVS